MWRKGRRKGRRKFRLRKVGRKRRRIQEGSYVRLEGLTTPNLTIFNGYIVKAVTHLMHLTNQWRVIHPDRNQEEKFLLVHETKLVAVRNSIVGILGLSQQNHREDFFLDWQHIANAMSHELYEHISSSFMVIVKGKKQFNDMDKLLEELKNTKRIHQHEIQYIRRLMERAIQFHHHNDEPKNAPCGMFHAFVYFSMYFVYPRDSTWSVLKII
eukprot:867629_1